MIERLFSGGEDANTDKLIEEMDGQYKDMVGLLHQKPDPAALLVLGSDELHFWYNFNDAEKMMDLFGLFAVAAHEMVRLEFGDDLADALLARVLAECICEEDD